jgi:hydroxymethylbilane synthase
VVKKLRIGMRSSPLSYKQTQEVSSKLEAQGVQVELQSFVTSGDLFLQKPLRDIGGKGLFTKEIEEALLRNEIDCAVHSYKDMPTQLPDELMIGAVLEREDPRDAWISREGKPLHLLAPGAIVGTASLRRQVILRQSFPDLAICEIRGNIQTRLEKMDRGEIDGLILAFAGLKRLGELNRITEVLPITFFCPATAQGALALECRKSDFRTLEMIRFLNHEPTSIATTVERAFLKALDGSCRTPIGCYADITEGMLWLRGFIAKKDATFFSWLDKKILLSGLRDPYQFGWEQGNLLLKKHQEKL